MTATKTKVAKVRREKIVDAVKLAIPKGRRFKVSFEDSALGGMKIVRVVTTAWKDLRPAERITRVRGAVEKALSQDEQDKILRFSAGQPLYCTALLAGPGTGEAFELLQFLFDGR
jgi:hypothetical protein